MLLLILTAAKVERYLGSLGGAPSSARATSHSLLLLYPLMADAGSAVSFTEKTPKGDGCNSFLQAARMLHAAWHQGLACTGSERRPGRLLRANSAGERAGVR